MMSGMGGRIRMAWMCLGTAFRAKSLYAFVLGLTSAFAIIVIGRDRLRQILLAGGRGDGN